MRLFHLFISVIMLLTTIECNAQVVVNECPTTNNCHPTLATCHNNFGGYHCTCNTGYVGSGKNCIDDNECLWGKCDANAACTNTIGSFSCTCKSGFTGDGLTCTVDPNKCPTTNNCHPTLATCHNNFGGYHCTCNTGYVGSGKNCIDDNECLWGKCDANAACTNTIGSFSCTCKSGFTGDGLTCTVDPNKCPTTNNCHPTLATCHNNFGGYHCTCNTGYVGSGKNCIDDNECLWGKCDANAACTNTIGSFSCTCKSGFTGDGLTCTVDPNKCPTTNNCHPTLATCHNNFGGYHCTCNTGYVGNGKNCIASCETKAINTSVGLLEFGSGLVNERVFSNTLCPDGRSLGSILCSATTNVKSPAIFNSTTLNYLECNKTLPQFLREVNLATLSSEALLEKQTDNLFLLMRNSSHSKEKAVEAVEFVSIYSRVLNERNIDVSVNTLSNIINSANIIAEVRNTSNVTNSEVLSKTLVTSLHGIASHVTLVGNSATASVETENLAVAISNYNPTSVNHENVVYKLNVTEKQTKRQKNAVNITVPSEAFDIAGESTNKSVQAVIFVFKGNGIFQTDQQTEWVLSADIGRNSNITNLTKPVIISFNEVEATPGLSSVQGSLQMLKTEMSCVYLNEKTNKWSSKGLCRVKGKTECQSTHLTSFSILVKRSNVDRDFTLSIVSTIGCCFSAFGLVITIVVHLCEEKVRKIRQTVIFLHICFVLTVFYVAFVFGVNRTKSEHVCTAITAFLQYILLAVWCWIAVYIHSVYRSITELAGKESKSYMKIACLFGYGCPIFLVATTIAVTFLTNKLPEDTTEKPEKICGQASIGPQLHLNYRSSHLCWLHKQALFYGFVVPSLVLFTFNVILYIMVMCKIAGRKNVSMRNIKRDAVIGATMAAILGFTWIFGYFMLVSNDAYFQTIMSWIFAVTSSTQGLLIFLLTAVRRSNLRKIWFKPLQSLVLNPISSVATRSVRTISNFQKSGMYDISRAKTESTTDVIPYSQIDSSRMEVGSSADYSSTRDGV